MRGGRRWDEARGPFGPSYPIALRDRCWPDRGEGSHDVNSQSPTPKRSRARRRVLFATLAAASLTGQVLTMSPAAQADDTLGGGRPKPPRPPSIIHGVQEFTADGTFTPPAGVTSVHIQAWGAAAVAAAVVAAPAPR
ncbi:hypothetical protein SANTM175S_07635 [Streptomyces antimycoticus]